MNRPGFSFLACPDSALLKQELERQAGGWKDAGEPKRLTFWGDEDPSDAFWESLGQVGLFSERRILIVRQAENWSATAWKQISSALARELEHVWPFFCLEVEVERGKLKIPAHILKTRCFTFAEKKGWVWRSPGLGANVQRYAVEQAKKLGLAFQGDALAMFCDACPQDAQGILSELQKLSLLAKDGQIRSEWLESGESAFEHDAFALIKQISRGDLASAWPAISADTEGGLLFFLVAMLSREMRILWQILVGETPRLYPGEAARKKELAFQLGYEGLGKGFAALADAEWQVKSGRQTPSQTLEMLAVRMAAIFKPRASGS